MADPRSFEDHMRNLILSSGTANQQQDNGATLRSPTFQSWRSHAASLHAEPINSSIATASYGQPAQASDHQRRRGGQPPPGFELGTHGPNNSAYPYVAQSQPQQGRQARGRQNFAPSQDSTFPSRESAAGPNQRAFNTPQAVPDRNLQRHDQNNRHAYGQRSSLDWRGSGSGQGQYGQPPGNYMGGRGQHDDQHRRPPVTQRNLWNPGSNTGSHTSTDLRPPYRQAAYLDGLAAHQVPTAGMPAEALATNESVRLQLESLAKSAFQLDPDTADISPQSVALECFGSIASGFATRESDMDIMLTHDTLSETVEKHKSIPRILEKALLDAGYGARLLTRTRVPIIRFCEYPPAKLLESLRRARSEWEQETAKLQAEGKSADDVGDASDNHDDNDGEEGGPPSPTEATAGRASDPAAKKDPKERNSRQEAVPRREKYTNDEERIRLYQLAIQEDWFDANERDIIQRYRAAYHHAGGSENDAALIEARTALDGLPDVLSRYREPRQRKQELEYPKNGVGVLCDINFGTGTHSNPLAIHNTRLLRCYSLIDDRIREMAIFVKAWAKIRKINKPYHGTLSSYGYVLMVLHFAVNIADPPLAPNLQLVHDRNSQTGFQAATTCNEYDIRFWQDEAAIRVAAVHEFGQNKQSVGSLLCQFFRYYGVNAYRGVQGFQWMRDVLSLRTPGGLVSKESKGWTGATEQAKDGEDGEAGAVKITHRYLLAIEDPFEHSHNVGRPVTHYGIIAIRDEFRRANQLVVSQGIWNGAPEDLFMEGIEKERPHKFFGPNPKHKRHAKPAPKKDDQKKETPVNSAEGPAYTMKPARKGANKAQKTAAKTRDGGIPNPDATNPAKVTTSGLQAMAAKQPEAPPVGAAGIKKLQSSADAKPQGTPQESRKASTVDAAGAPTIGSTPKTKQRRPGSRKQSESGPVKAEAPVITDTPSAVGASVTSASTANAAAAAEGGAPKPKGRRLYNNRGKKPKQPGNTGGSGEPAGGS